MQPQRLNPPLVQPPPAQNNAPSPLWVIGSSLLKVGAISALAVLMVYPALGLADKAFSEIDKGYEGHTIAKFMGLSMGLGMLVSLVCLVIAMQGLGESQE